MKPLSIRGVRLDRQTNTPVLMLREEEPPRRQFEIFIGAPEAASITMALEGQVTPRPLTHDLFVQTLERLSVSIVRVVLTHVTDGTFYAELVVSTETGGEFSLSCRPSDGVAVALRANCPTYALEELLEAVGQLGDEESATGDSSILDEFRDFIETIKPEDFGS